MILMDKIYRPLRILMLIIFVIVNLVAGHREHKVHNITLYPDKHSWCHVLPIKQVISYSGCESVQIDNNVCVGACFSYSIPHTEPSDPGEVIVPYCDSCQPSETEWRHVQLKCDQQNDDPDSPDGELLKRVQIIKNCSCTSCEKDKYLQQKLLGYNSNNDNDDDNDLLHNENNIPDLLNILQIRNETKNYNLTKNNDLKSLLNHHIITLLKNIQSDNLQKDKEQLINALRIVQYDQLNNIDHNNNNNDNNIAEFVDSLNTENIELDIPHLREILIKYEESKNLEKYKKQNMLLNNDNINILSNNNDNINNDDHNKHIGNRHHNHHHHHQHLPSNIDNDQIDDKMNKNNLLTDNSLLLTHQNQINHHHHHPHHNHHHNHQLHDNKDHTTNSSIPTQSTTIINNNKEQNDNNNNTNNNHHQHHHHHHIGEKIDEIHQHGHLVRGPHNSLIIKPENDDNDNDKPTLSSISSSSVASTILQQHRIHEKLDVNPHELKPNHAGTLLSYSSHSTSSSDGGTKNKNLI